MSKTFDADSGQPVDDAGQPTVTPLNPNQIPSLVRIPPQIATTAVWIGIGFLLGLGTCYYISERSKRGHRREA